MSDDDALNQFVEVQHKQLRINAHKGTRERWINEPLDMQLMQAQIALAKLRIALAYGQDVTEKCADLANFAFFIQDNFHNNKQLINLPPDKRFSGD